MSRVAKNPVAIPNGVTVDLNKKEIHVKGAKGSLSLNIHEEVSVTEEAGFLHFVAVVKPRPNWMMAGTTRVLVNNMIIGVSSGFERQLKLIGVGYRAQVQGRVLNLNLGFSHPVNFDIPEGIDIDVPVAAEIIVKGADKQKVGQVAADIRSYRPPEPYKGKGIRYADEHVKLKETKKK
jgi:large subunit ribosomal protein L6